ncbi:endonuclease V isoform X3 [Esox lucius]|uniref:endonuclease V isoform X3 n=1 Tax=Esox lucius TaxID=8010 RepID=UPI0014768E8C|nr:endonuclease V isoform X3 [Esox lucius]
MGKASLRQLMVEEDTEDWQRSPDFTGLERVGGVDLSFVKGDDVNACAQLVVLSYPDLELLYEDSQMVTLTAPYIAGFLAFRETPYLLEALQRLEKTQPNLLPQVVLVDGNGLFHYREFGLACHLGVLSGLPCVGVAKNLLQVQGVTKSQQHQLQIASLQKGGDSFPLTAASGKVLGKALRSSDSSTKPVYVSTGHRISLETALRLTHTCCRYRVPEPIRQQHVVPQTWMSSLTGSGPDAALIITIVYGLWMFSRKQRTNAARRYVAVLRLARDAASCFFGMALGLDSLTNEIINYRFIVGLCLLLF